MTNMVGKGEKPIIEGQSFDLEFLTEIVRYHTCLRTGIVVPLNYKRLAGGANKGDDALLWPHLDPMCFA